MSKKFSQCRMCGEPLAEPTEAWRAFCDETCYLASVLSPTYARQRKRHRSNKAKRVQDESVSKRQINLFDIAELPPNPPTKKRTRKNAKA